MKSIFLLFFSVLLFFSCERKSEKQCYDHEMIILLKEDSENQLIQIQDNLNDKIYNVKKGLSKDFHIYDSLTKDYISYLDKIASDLIAMSDVNSEWRFIETNHVDAYFFEKGDYSEVSNEYIKKTDSYKNEIESLTTNYFMSSRIVLALNTSGFLNGDGEEIKHLEYYIKDMTLGSAITYFTNHKRKILELENYYLYETLLESKQN